MRSLLFDARDALRSLRRDRGYAATVILTLALAVGATTAVFSIVNGVLLKPLAFRESQQLVSLRETWQQLAATIPVLAVNEHHFEYWRAHARTFDSMAQFVVAPANLTGAGEAAQVLVVRASGSLFDVLRVNAAIGRTFTPGDEPSGGADVAVITDGMWRRRLGGDRAVIGRQLVLDGKPRTIVGVLPADFALPGQANAPEAFVPIHMDAERVGWEGDHNNDAIGRLRAGATLAQATAELDVLQAQVSTIASTEAGEAVTLAAVVTPLAESVVGRSRTGLLLLLGAIGAVLLIACSNLANLSLTRAAGRLRDAAIRSALGAARSRLVARALVEQLLLAAAGGALGLGVAAAALVVFVKSAPIDLPRVAEVSLDARVVAFAVAMSALAGVLVALLPAWRLSRRDVEQALRAGALTTTSDRAGTRTRGTLVAIQIALALPLLVVTTLLGASFVRLMDADRGFVADHVLVVPLSLPPQRYSTDATRLPVYDRLVADARTIPGVRSATTVSTTPLSGSVQVNGIAPEGSIAPRSEQPPANYRFVGPDFFRTLNIPVVRGRPFRDGEGRGSGTMPALVSDRTALRIWPGENAVGKRFSRGVGGEAGFEVVGIVADAKITSLDRTPPLMVYVPYWWRSRGSVTMLFRTAVEPAAIMADVRRTIAAIDQEIAIGDVRTLDAIVDSAVAGRKYQLRLFVVFGGIALAIAALGVYAVTAYSISRRRREMNIRVALGAQRSQVMRMVVGQSAVPIAAGLAGGSAVALGLGTAVASLLFDVRSRDPLLLSTAVALVASVGVAACVVAASRGLRLDPARALREE